MITIIETLVRLVVLVATAFVQACAAILGGISTAFGFGCLYLQKLSSKILKKLDQGKYEEKMREIAVK